MTLSARARRAGATAVGALGALAALGVALAAWAQRVDPKRPRTLTVGAPSGASPAARVDARRTGLARAPLPRGPLRVAWQAAVGAPIDGAPLVDASGNVLVTTSRGEVIALDRDSGAELPRAGLAAGGAKPACSPALLADGTVVFANEAGEAVGARGGALRFRTAVSDAPRRYTAGAGVLALDDGGAAIAIGQDLAVIDADGNARARDALDEGLGAPLVAVPAQRKIAVITASGKVYLWAPGRPPVRAGSFGAAVDGAAALVDDRTLVAVSGAQLLELDLTRGVAAARMSSPTVLLGPPAFRGDVAYLLASAPGRVFALTIDGTGQELARVAVTTSAASADAGAASAIPEHTGPLVDAAGTLAFGTPEGEVGVLTKDGALELLGDPVCLRTGGLGGRAPAPPPSTAAYAGLAPAGPRAFVVACQTGAVLKITSAEAPL